MKQKITAFTEKKIYWLLYFAPNQHIYLEELYNFTNNILESNKVYSTVYVHLLAGTLKH